MTYDSRTDTIDHINAVRNFMRIVIDNLQKRAQHHDKSKLESPEKEAFDVLTPRLKGLTYGSDEYRACLKEMKPAIEHHYANNSHHPEHYKYWRCPICEGVFPDDAAPPSVYENNGEPLRFCPNCCANGVIFEATVYPTTGIYGMDLLDVVEMLCDWKAAGMRHADGDILKSLEINRERFKMSDQLYRIFKNTIERVTWK